MSIDGSIGNISCLTFFFHEDLVLPFCWFKNHLSVMVKGMYTKYWLLASDRLVQEQCVKDYVLS